MPEIKLKPCPFCGSAAKIRIEAVRGLSQNYIRYSVYCPECKIRKYCDLSSGSSYDAGNAILDKVIEDWNRRTENEMSVQSASWEFRYDEDYDDELHCCSICGKPDALSRDDYSYRGGKIRDNDSNYCPNCGAKMDGG